LIFFTYLGNHTKNPKLSEFYLTNFKPKTPLLGVHSYSALVNKSSFKMIVRKYHINTKNQLGYYLAGLIEGDGSIIVRQGKREAIAPIIVFTFHKNEMPLYEKLKEIINSGYILVEKSGVGRYCITNPDTIIQIINLINGKFRTPKYHALYKAIDNVNKWRNANISKLPLDTSSLDTNAWLAGFIDSDGHFSIKLTGCYGSDNSESRGRVQCVFSINQSELNRVSGESNITFMKNLAEFFQVNLNHKVENSPLFKKPAKKVVLYAQSDRRHYIITSYLTKYPLMSSKYLNYLSFFKGLNYLGKRLTSEEILEVRTIKQSMNNSRTEYNWDHLNNFYN